MFMRIYFFCVTKCRNLQHLSIILHAVSKNNMWASHGLDRFCVRPYSVIGPELQVTSKATGIDKIPAKVLKLSADIIAPSLTTIFNQSLHTGIFVNDWKLARVQPIYKSEDRSKCENYRPISILPVVSKIFEKEIFQQLYRVYKKKGNRTSARYCI